MKGSSISPSTWSTRMSKRHSSGQREYDAAGLDQGEHKENEHRETAGQYVWKV